MALATAGWSYPDPSMYMVMASNLRGTTPDGGTPQLVWLARWTGFSLNDPEPALPDGASPLASRPPLSYAYFLVDGRTGDDIQATEAEAP